MPPFFYALTHQSLTLPYYSPLCPTKKARRLIWLTFPLFPALRPAHYDASKADTEARMREAKSGANGRVRVKTKTRAVLPASSQTAYAARGRMYRKTQINIHVQSTWYFIFGHSPKRYWLRTSAPENWPASHALFTCHP